MERSEVLRGIAAEILMEVVTEKKHLEDALDQNHVRIPQGFRPWVQDVCSGVLRLRGRLEAILKELSTRPKKPRGILYWIFLIALYQILFQERAVAAEVVNETVAWIKKRKGLVPSRFANGILRAAVKNQERWLHEDRIEASDPKQEALWASLPEWMWRMLVRQRGSEWTKQYALSTMKRPRVWLRYKENEKPPLLTSDLDSKGDPESELVFEEGPVSQSFVVHHKKGQGTGSIDSVPGYGLGNWIVQDISSQFLVVEMAKKIREEAGERSLRILDLCAAPGGKSIALSWLGFDVTATDINQKRLELLRQNVQRTGAPVRVLDWDLLEKEEPFDWVWIDAPCTGSGIIRRHPDVKWHRTEKDLDTLCEAQKSLIDECVLKGQVKEKGWIAYTVCSVLPDEGSDLIRRAGVDGHVTAEWLLSPQDPPFGDGFYGAIWRVP